MRALGLAHLRVSVDLRDPASDALLDRAGELAISASAALEVLVVDPGLDARLDEVMARLADLRVPLARLMAVDPDGNTTTAALAERTRAAMGRAGLDAPLVGLFARLSVPARVARCAERPHRHGLVPDQPAGACLRP